MTGGSVSAKTQLACPAPPCHRLGLVAAHQPLVPVPVASSFHLPAVFFAGFQSVFLLLETPAVCPGLVEVALTGGSDPWLLVALSSQIQALLSHIFLLPSGIDLPFLVLNAANSLYGCRKFSGCVGQVSLYDGSVLVLVAVASRSQVVLSHISPIFSGVVPHSPALNA
eukprot:CAMPEP_0116845456 /NCGR_PEP_ID=MMETSP0418-20121206/13276_1 /TAXON_ID=1158023 /ORGANISM="Astrosyne radiata, Strain 13vi08-1A" /LENGTH=167 /DNA_ID=CAMNT_0004476567 /DNA_START=770 /DNA_END=1273 /DNA_ORIENTATION=+